MFTPSLGPLSHAAGTATLGEAAGRMLSKQLERLRAATANEGWMSGASEVKAARTSARRLRAALRFFGPHLDAKRAARLQREIELLTAALGGVRDCDVVLRELDKFNCGSELALLGCINQLRTARELAEERLQRYAKRSRLRPLCSRIARYSASVCRADARRSVYPTATLLQQRYDGFRQRVRGLDLEDVESIHRVRRALRRLRYGRECVVGSITVDVEFVTAVKAAQDHLGRLNDLDLAIKTITRILDVGVPVPDQASLNDYLDVRRGELRALVQEVPAVLNVLTELDLWTERNPELAAR